MPNQFTNFSSRVTSTCSVLLGGEDGNAILAECFGTPPTTAGVFAHGCYMMQKNPAVEQPFYINTGTLAVPVWSDPGGDGGGSPQLATETLTVTGNSATLSHPAFTIEAVYATTGGSTGLKHLVPIGTTAGAGEFSWPSLDILNFSAVDVVTEISVTYRYFDS